MVTESCSWGGRGVLFNAEDVWPRSPDVIRADAWGRVCGTGELSVQRTWKVTQGREWLV